MAKAKGGPAAVPLRRVRRALRGTEIGHPLVVSWDVYAFIPPPGAVSIDDVPSDYRPPELGSREEVVERIRSVAPLVDASDPARLSIVGPDHVVEVSLTEERPTGLTFFVRGGEAAVPLVQRVSSALGAVPFDISTGEFMTAGSGIESLATWRSYRDRVVGDNEA